MNLDKETNRLPSHVSHGSEARRLSAGSTAQCNDGDGCSF